MIGRASLRLGKVGPIEISVNVTWLVVFALLVYWLRFRYLTEVAPELERSAAWTLSVVGAFVLFGSVLAHELSHSLVALRDGLQIRKITLFIFGGVAHMESEPQSPGVESRMAIAGPAASLVIAALCALGRFASLRIAGSTTAAVILEYAMAANLALACFNLLPAFPLDGGRVLRALLWRVTGSFTKATLVAAGVGRAFGLLMVFAGVTLAVGTGMPVFLWPALVGTFLERLAYISARRARPARRPPAQTVLHLMTTPIPTYYNDQDPK
jgi:Zn-dependent protease